MKAKSVPHLEFAPPPQPGQQSAWWIAGLAHGALFLALGLATAWKTQIQTVQAEAELWSTLPQAAAPRAQEPGPSPAVPTPATAPQKPAQRTPPPAPDPELALRDAQIALEKKKQLEKKKEAEKLKAEQLRKEREKQEKEAQDKADKDKALKEKALKEKKAEEERDRKKAEDKNKADAEQKKRKQEQAQKAAQDKADEVSAETLRKENLQRMQGMAGASGGSNATGSALKSSGPSASYAGRLVGRIKPNITYPGEAIGNPRAEVEVKVNPDGTILSRRIVQSSGNKAWDDAVLRAIDKTEVFPRDSDGRVPPLMVLGFRPLD